jgi:hypothetical protein
LGRMDGLGDMPLRSEMQSCKTTVTTINYQHVVHIVVLAPSHGHQILTSESNQADMPCWLSGSQFEPICKILLLIRPSPPADPTSHT